MAYKCVSYIDKLCKKRGSFTTNAGTPMFDQYEYQIVDGIKMLVKCKPVNRQEEIQSYAKSCDISNILNRFMNGEVDLLNAAGNGFYADIRDMPTTYAEYFQRVKHAKDVFLSLPKEVKDAFDNDPEKFFTSYGSEDFNSKILSLSKKDENKTNVSASGKESEVTNAE